MISQSNRHESEETSSVFGFFAGTEGSLAGSRVLARFLRLYSTLNIGFEESTST